jgi:adenylate cyclase
MTRDQLWSRGTLRSTSALVMLAYVICHLGNHMALLISVPFASNLHQYLIGPWRTVPGTTLLLTAFLAHYGNALWSIYMRRSLALPRWAWWQLGLGLSIPLILLLHVSDTRLSEIDRGVISDYASVLLRQWVLAPWRGVAQVIFLSVVWAHAALGIHFWLRNKRWYAPWRPYLAVFALLWPVLALAGYVSGGNQVLRAAQQSGYIATEMANAHLDAPAMAWANEVALLLVLTHIVLVNLAFAARGVRSWVEGRRNAVLLTHANGRTMHVRASATLLEALNEHHVPHAQVCGGRARCTTCRVRVVTGLDTLPAPSAVEAHALARIGAPDNCRLACQVRPVADLSIVPLLSPSARPIDGHGHTSFDGAEQVVTVMFVDIRGSTRLGEARLPYDILFLLDQFFLEMSTALSAAGGHFSQFTGDGLMALFGLDDGDAAASARAALRAAVDMKARLERLNARLIPDLAEPLRIGIGIHHGDAIVGRLGPPGSKIVTAIGDTVNTAARIEGLSKTHQDRVIISRRAAEAAGLDLAREPAHSAVVAGRVEPIEYYALGGVALEQAHR